MMERVALTAVVIAGVGYLLYRWLLADGADIHSARNLLLLQLVLFQNIVVGNARSETHSGFRISPFRNPLPLFGVVAAQLIHIGALYVVQAHRAASQRSNTLSLVFGSLNLLSALAVFYGLTGTTNVARMHTAPGSRPVGGP